VFPGIRTASARATNAPDESQVQYVARYRQALSSYLAQDYLLDQVATLNAMAVAVARPEELESLEDARLAEVRQ